MDPGEADALDYHPGGGTVEFGDQQVEASIYISILDDSLPENMEVCGEASLCCFNLLQ